VGPPLSTRDDKLTPVARAGEPELSVARGAAYGLGADAATVVSGLVLAVIVARFLGPENRGIYALAVLVGSLVAIVGDAGMSTSGIVFGANRRVPLRHLHGTALLLSLAVAALTALAVIGLGGWLTREVLKGVTRDELWLVTLAIIPLLYSQVVAAMLTGMGRLRSLAMIRVAAAVGVPLLMLVVVWASGGSPYWAIVGWLGGTLLLAVPIAVVATRSMGRPTPPALPEARTLFRFGLRAWIGTMSHHGYLRTDVLFISARLGPAPVGQYSLASVLAERISLAGSAVYSSGASRIGSGDRAMAEALVARLVRLLVVAVAPLVVVLGLLSWILIPAVFGDDFSPAIVPFVLLLPGTAALTVWYVLGLFIVAALERPGMTTAIQGSAMLISLPLYWVAVSEWGMTGAAIVSSSIYVGVLTAGVLIFRRYRSGPSASLVPRREDVRQSVAFARDALSRGRSVLHA
jgi:O-antigen/teichoic acid export membrane protein